MERGHPARELRLPRVFAGYLRSCDCYHAVMTTTAFHFSPRPNRAAEINWRPWSPEAFSEAERDDKPVLLGISAVWCHWCHVMDETTYSDAENIGLINERFVAIRVDNDQRPDINARYNMGGWPTTAFLTPGGEVMAGMTYIPPDQMRDILNQVSGYYKDNKASIEEKLGEILANREKAMAAAPDGTELTDQILRDVLHATHDAYDPVFGGFGNEPKFPHADAIDLLLHAYLRDGDRDSLHMARKTLEHMCSGGTYDQEWGGFYRYSTKRDWSIPHYEKMLEDNAPLLKALLKLYRISQNDEHKRYIDFAIAYLDEWLSDPESGCFWGSQDADEDFYPLSAEQRKQHAPPYVDKTIYASWNAMAISAYLEASWTRGRPDLKERALKALDFLWSSLRTDADGMYRYLAPDGPKVAGLLGDQAWMALALLDAHEATSRPEDLARALRLAAFMQQKLGAPGGGFYDTPEGHDALGRLSQRQKPVKENAIAAMVFTRLARITHDETYEHVARRALVPFVNVAESQGYFASDYAKAVDLLLNPGAEIKIVAAVGDPDGHNLHSAALALEVPDRIVRMIDANDSARMEREALPPHPAPAAYVCYGTLCSAPVTTADDLFDMVSRTRQAYEATRPQEPLAGPRSERASD
jgi:uncharacterized protein YyaL (SSP411 family)